MSSILPASPQPTGPEPAGAPSRGTGLYSGLVASTVKYLLRTEVHTFAFSVAANAILSFFPFALLLLTLIRRVFHSRVMYDVVLQLLRDSLPTGQDFLIRNLTALVNARHRAQIASLLILLVTSTGIFMPLEVALNRIWHFPNNRSYIGNQLISLGLAFACGVLALLSIALTAENVSLVETLLRGHAMFIVHLVGFVVMKLTAMAASIAIFVLIYWLLPNGKVPIRAVIPTAVIMGLLSEVLKYAYILALPTAELSGSVWAIRPFREPDVLGFPVRIAAADRSQPLRPAARTANGGSLARSCIFTGCWRAGFANVHSSQPSCDARHILSKFDSLICLRLPSKAGPQSILRLCDACVSPEGANWRVALRPAPVVELARRPTYRLQRHSWLVPATSHIRLHLFRYRPVRPEDRSNRPQ